MVQGGGGGGQVARVVVAWTRPKTPLLAPLVPSTSQLLDPPGFFFVLGRSSLSLTCLWLTGVLWPEDRAFSHGNYLPALDELTDLLRADAGRQVQVLVIFLSDGAPSDHQEFQCGHGVQVWVRLCDGDKGDWRGASRTGCMCVCVWGGGGGAVGVSACTASLASASVVAARAALPLPLPHQSPPPPSHPMDRAQSSSGRVRRDGKQLLVSCGTAPACRASIVAHVHAECCHKIQYLGVRSVAAQRGSRGMGWDGEGRKKGGHGAVPTIPPAPLPPPSPSVSRPSCTGFAWSRPIEFSHSGFWAPHGGF